MRSTFAGLETARRGMTTQQSALSVTGHNIANANTPGYSRQRVNFVQTESFPPVSMNRPQIPGQIGTGVTAGSVERIRETYLDVQYRGESTKSGYWGARASALSAMEDIMNEPSDVGLSKALDEMWKKMQDVASNPQNSGARDVAITQASAVADTFKYISDSLSGIRTNLDSEISLAKDSINSLVSQINSYNEKIASLEPHGLLPNDLYDARDNLVDQLSQFVNIRVTPVGSGGQALDIATGKYTIDIVSNTGATVGTLIDGRTLTAYNLEVGKNSEGFVDRINIGGKIENGVLVGGRDISVENMADGTLKGHIEAYGYDRNMDPAISENVGLYPDMMDQLDKLAYSFVKEFNAVHRQGYDLSGNTGKDFFVDFPDLSGANNQYKDAAKNIKLGITLGSEIAAGATTGAGNNENAYKLSDVITKGFAQFDNTSNIPNKLGMKGDLKSFYGGMIGTLGVIARETNIKMETADYTMASVDTNRQSVSGVSLDEEMTSLIKFQHAYNASARNITVIDEMLDKIINGLGTGGR